MRNSILLVVALFVVFFGVTFSYGLWKTSEVIHNYTLQDRLSSDWIAWTIQQYVVFLVSGAALKFMLNYRK